jgi:hypothetical protein
LHDCGDGNDLQRLQQWRATTKWPMTDDATQLYGVALPSRERRLAIVAIVGLAVWIVSPREFRSAAAIQVSAMVFLSAWAGMASLWFP